MCVKLIISKTKVIFSTRRTHILIYDNKLYESSVTNTDPIKDLGVFLVCGLHLHNHVSSIIFSIFFVVGCSGLDVFETKTYSLSHVL
jgi:hypothetical protein